MVSNSTCTTSKDSWCFCVCASFAIFFAVLPPLLSPPAPSFPFYPSSMLHNLNHQRSSFPLFSRLNIVWNVPHQSKHSKESPDENVPWTLLPLFEKEVFCNRRKPRNERRCAQQTCCIGHTTTLHSEYGRRNTQSDDTVPIIFWNFCARDTKQRPECWK